MDTFEIIQNDPENKFKEIKEQVAKNRELADARINILNDKLNSVEKIYRDEIDSFFQIVENKLSDTYKSLSLYIDTLFNQSKSSQIQNNDYDQQLTILAESLKQEIDKLTIDSRTNKFKIEGIEFNFKEYRDSLTFKLKRVDELTGKLDDIMLHLDTFENKIIEKFSKATNEILVYDYKSDLNDYSGDHNKIAIVKKGLFTKGAYYFDGNNWKKI